MVVHGSRDGYEARERCRGRPAGGSRRLRHGPVKVTEMVLKSELLGMMMWMGGPIRPGPEFAPPGVPLVLPNPIGCSDSENCCQRWH